MLLYLCRGRGEEYRPQVYSTADQASAGIGLAVQMHGLHTIIRHQHFFLHPAVAHQTPSVTWAACRSWIWFALVSQFQYGGQAGGRKGSARGLRPIHLRARAQQRLHVPLRALLDLLHPAWHRHY